MQSRVKNAGRYWRARGVLVSSVFAACLLAAAHAGAAGVDDSTASDASQSAGFSTVLEAWLGFPGLAQSSAPYTYLRATRTADKVEAKRQDLIRELDDLRWRLQGRGYGTFVQAVDQWKSKLATSGVFREPGDWSPAWLMAHPHRNPPISHVAAIGACAVPDWVEVWSGKGVTRTPWHTRMTLSDLAKNDVIDLDGISIVSVVAPTGEVQRLGQAAFNYSDSELLPGSRVVLPLPLGGEAFAWIRDTIAQLLAHAPAGENCKEMRFADMGASQ
ncbi:hypothetical protein T35B1_06620 [Salinisphaera shabanensis T35B1]|jgi:hypothetical protein|uniref:hypothetical protein n=1 Tax=Salinisphaera shabanensis TaxID=180542 RepID=UPI00333F114A